MPHRRREMLVALVLVSTLLCAVSGDLNKDWVQERVGEVYPNPQLKQDRLMLTQFSDLLLHLEHAPWHANDNSPRLANFDCEVYGPSDPVPDAAADLRPADIKVLGALGDSLTAAFGARAKSIFDLFIESRGVSYAIGGDGNADSVLTLGNILRQYNPDLKGLSLGQGGVDSAGAHLNLAVSGAIIQDLEDQVNNLVAKMKATPDIDYDNDWKMVSILMGHNNLCAYCKDSQANGPDTFGRLLEASLDLLYAQMPRVFVNLLAPIDVTVLYEASTGLCALLHWFECGCAVNSDPNQRARVSEAHKGYYAEMQRVAALPKYGGRVDFAVEVQPFLEKTDIPKNANGKPDTTYLAPDCFHFSAKAHQAAAVGLWNNVVETDKQTAWVPGEALKCPAQGAVLPTTSRSQDSTPSKDLFTHN